MMYAFNTFNPEDFTIEEMLFLSHLYAFSPQIPPKFSILEKIMILGKKLQNQADSRVSAYSLANLPSEN